MKNYPVCNELTKLLLSQQMILCGTVSWRPTSYAVAMASLKRNQFPHRRSALLCARQMRNVSLWPTPLSVMKMAGTAIHIKRKVLRGSQQQIVFSIRRSVSQVSSDFFYFKQQYTRMYHDVKIVCHVQKIDMGLHDQIHITRYMLEKCEKLM